MSAASSSSSAPLPDPQRGEVWQVNFDPSRGDEIRKHRPAVVVSVATAGKLALRVIVPLTGWHPAFARAFWHTQIAPTPANGLTKTSSADAFQVRSLSLERFVQRFGTLTPTEMNAIAQTIATVTGTPAPPAQPENDTSK